MYVSIFLGPAAGATKDVVTRTKNGIQHSGTLRAVMTSGVRIRPLPTTSGIGGTASGFTSKPSLISITRRRMISKPPCK